MLYVYIYMYANKLLTAGTSGRQTYVYRWRLMLSEYNSIHLRLLKSGFSIIFSDKVVQNNY